MQLAYVYTICKVHKYLRDFTDRLWAFLEHFYKNNGLIDRDLELTKKIYPARQTYSDFIKNHLDEIPYLK